MFLAVVRHLHCQRHRQREKEQDIGKLRVDEGEKRKETKNERKKKHREAEERRRRIAAWNHRHQRAPPSATAGQLLLLLGSARPRPHLHYSANEQWRVNYNSLSNVHVASEQWRAIVHCPAQSKKNFKKKSFRKFVIFPRIFLLNFA